MANLSNSVIGNQHIGRGQNIISNTTFGCNSQNPSVSLNVGGCNTSMGVNSLKSLTTGVMNTAIGYKALCSVNIGSYNVAAGYNAGTTTTSGTNNTFLGACAGLISSGTRLRNTAVGFLAMKSVDGDNNTAIGYCAMTRASGVDTSSNNVAIGYKTGNYSSGNGNVTIGTCTRSYSAYNTLVGGGRYTSGICSVQVGYGPGYTAGACAIALGYKSSATGTNSIAVGHLSSSSNNNWITWGNSSNNTRNCIWSRWFTLSDQKDKTNIQSLDSKYGIDFIKKLKPKSFCWDNRETYVRECGFEFGQKDGTLTSNEENYGFIAQEVKDTINELDINFDALDGEENDAYRLQYSEFISPIIKTVQEIAERLDILNIELTQLEIV